ncbi:MAG TPA: hypothetical protein VGO47_11685 [Chlamydiales bacterium]|nr:hypothetical protein [Chlamydiales bacterium]
MVRDEEGNIMIIEIASCQGDENRRGLITGQNEENIMRRVRRRERRGNMVS